MGMYTRLNLSCIINKADEKELEILRYMMGDEEHEVEIPPEKDCPLFHTERWRIMLQCYSAYFDHVPHNHLIQDEYNPNEYYFLVDSDLKNYHSEIEKFIAWIRPLSTTTGFVGYWIYEEDDDPALIYFGYNTTYKITTWND